MSRIFISHSSVNNAPALAIAQWLRDNGWDDYFLDVAPTRGLAPGERWQEALKAAAHRCEAVIFLVSPAWRDSRWCLAEFLLAKSLGKVIFGVLVEPIAIDTLLPEMTAEWQLCDLATGGERIGFRVSQDPIVPPTQVSFARAGLEKLKLGLQKAGLDASTFLWPPPNQPDRSPYPGLRPLDTEDAAVFFGRDAAIVRGLDELRGLQERGVERMLVILGASGAGKSSFLRAGLWPRLERDDRRFLPLPVIRPERAAITGATGLAASLETALRKRRKPNGRPKTRAQIRAELVHPGGLLPLLCELQELALPSAAADTLPPTIIIPVDQGEELFATDGRDEAEEFLSRLGEALAPPTGKGAEAIAARRRCLAVLAMRSDSYERVQAEPRLAQVEPRLFNLRPMESHEYKAVIEGPAARATVAGAKLTIDPRLTERLLTDTEGADALPLLAFTLERLFVQYGTDGDLKLEEYEELGGVRGSIEAAIAEAFANPGKAPVIPREATEQDRRLRLGFIPWLARVDPDTEERKRRLACWNEIPEAARSLLARLVERRLLTRDRRRFAETDEETELVEIAHEALLRQWSKLSAWLDEEAGHLKTAEAVRRAAREWSQRDRHIEWLVHSGERLNDAESVRDREGFAKLLGEEGQTYLCACREQEEATRRQEEEARRRELVAAQQQAEAERRARLSESRRLKWMRGFAVVVLGLMTLAGWQWRSAKREEARTRQALADSAFLQACKVAESNTEEALGRLAQAMRLAPEWQAPQSLAASLLISVPPSVILQHHDQVFRASFSPDGTRIVTASLSSKARVWDSHTGELLTESLDHGGWLTAASFSPDGMRIVTASRDFTARVWDAHTGKLLTEPLEHQGCVNAASFSPDGTRILTASDDKTARVWDARTGEPLTKPLLHQGPVNAASFSPDGTRIVTASRDTAWVWDARTGERLTKPYLRQANVMAASFSPNGARIVTASRDTAWVWDARSGERIGKPLQHKSHRISDISFSPDSMRIVSAFDDGTAWIWDAHTGEPLMKPFQHQGAVMAASFSPDGTSIVTATYDGTARVWDARTGEPVTKTFRHYDEVWAASFSPDGTRIVTASFDMTAQVWETRPLLLLTKPLQHECDVFAASFSPDGTRVVTASEGGARVWDTRSGKPLTKLLLHEKAANTASYSPDGTRIVTASDDKTARVWDARTGEPLSKPLQHQGPVKAASFSPDGTRIVTASDDKTARVWDARTGEPLTRALQHKGPVKAASFSRDGIRIVTASGDTARVWDARTGEPLTKPLQHDNAVTAASFSPDRTCVITASGNKVCVWDARIGEPLTQPLEHEDAVVAVSFSPDGTRIIIASGDMARVWDARTWKPLKDPVKGTSFSQDGTVHWGDSARRVQEHTWKPLTQALQHKGPVKAASFSPDGKRIVTASDDKTARVWDARTGESLTQALQHRGHVIAASFSPDGTRIVTASDDKTASVWDVPLFPPEQAAQLADLAEAIGGFVVNDIGAVVPIGRDQFALLYRLRGAFMSAPEGQNTVPSFGRWLFTNAWTRTISPLSSVTVPQYINDAIQRGAVEEAQRAFPGHPLLRSSPVRNSPPSELSKSTPPDK